MTIPPGCAALRGLPVSALLALSLALSAGAGELRTRFSLVSMGEIPQGVAVAPRLADGSYYSLENTSDRPMKVRVGVEIPGFCEPVPGERPYRAIPDGRWVRFEPEVLDLPPHSVGEVLITVTVPEDPAFAAGRYEFWVRAEALLGQMGVALVSRVRFATRPGAAAGGSDAADGATDATGAADGAVADGGVEPAGGAAGGGGEIVLETPRAP